MQTIGAMNKTSRVLITTVRLVVVALLVFLSLSSSALRAHNHARKHLGRGHDASSALVSEQVLSSRQKRCSPPAPTRRPLHFRDVSSRLILFRLRRAFNRVEGRPIAWGHLRNHDRLDLPLSEEASHHTPPDC